MKTKSVRRLDGQGRVILPSHIRKAMNLTTDSAVTIDMTEGGKIIITPTQERCCICGEGVEGQPHITIGTWNGDKKICKTCADQVAYCAEQIRGGVRE